ncbi:hypothetical protein GIB67_038187 [Kingdonia uniflora]|uniref:Trehalose 6-phosphate phosphatase n=1 Tax=Kingdonia uniflora TaxID=39325 RepID=A0A7J7NHG7_9MAGN|nr:hypothetical protein GIB67_038187 [Kingdonia uniflora]
MLVVSEFIGCSPSLSGAIRVNPWDIDAVAEAMYFALLIPEAEKQLRHEKHYSWKQIAEPVMKLYTKTTDGSTIEDKETSLVWSYEDADPDFGYCQAKELLDHLESVLVNDPVTVKSGQSIVEVEPQGVSKGLVAQRLLSTMQERGKLVDFVIYIGDDRSDEDMFKVISNSMEGPSLSFNAQVFACTVGRKPNKAKYYLDDTVEIVRLIKGLASVSQQVLPFS